MSTKLLGDLRARLQKEREALKSNSGSGVLFSESGPVSMGLIEVLCQVVEEQQKQIDELKRK